ncbi:neutral zinc metallopeptidase [Herbidospora cretacea]|uniref:neutral zinc metallopeptidase n=1 Tax=Herbidospora cretacea TaxID=28444 RepID=UPI0012DE3277|nr:neutral zinc metallopeptidase [Herbidospora cretacea]
MRRALIPGLVSALALTGLASPAGAHPQSDPLLAENALYSTGPLPRSSCAEKPVKRRNHYPTAKAYVTFVAACLDRVWSKQFAKAKLPYRKPKLLLLAKNPVWHCDLKWDKRWTSSYCGDHRTITMVLDRRLLRDPGDLSLFTLTAALYGEHVQRLAGIEKAWLRALPEPSDLGYETDVDDIVRRVLLQAECFGAAFTSSVYGSMPRDRADWTAIVRKRTKERHTGSPENITYWLNQGFTSRDLQDCNTWRAENWRVA